MRNFATFAIPQKNNWFGWESYLGQACGSEKRPPYAVPARRGDLTGFPPRWISVGTLDLFYDEDVAYAQTSQRLGVECELGVIPGAFYGFDSFDYNFPVVQEFQQSQIAAMRKYLNI